MCAVAALALTTLSAPPIRAAGLYFGDRGVRPLGRGGAFVAGADDGGSVAYNPAGLAFAGESFLFDIAWLNYTSTYQRDARLEQVDPNTGQPTGQTWDVTYPAVEGHTPILPIPTIVYTNSLGQKNMNFALGVWAPYAAVTSFPEKVNGQAAPQRYSLITLDGSALAVVGAYGAWRPSKEIALGAGVGMFTGYFQTSVYLSACVPDTFICAPEQPEYDAYAQLRVGPIFAPGAIVGAIFLPTDTVRIGLSAQSPVYVDSRGTEKVRLPSASAFDQAHLDGNGVTVKFWLPYVLRFGVEYRPTEIFRIEAGVAYEGWAMHDKIEVESNDEALVDVAGFPKVFKLPPLAIERHFQNSYSARTGAELTFPLSGYKLGLRAGVAYEKSAIPKEYLSATTIDLDKVTLSGGGSLYIGKWRFDAVIARVIGTPVTVGLDEQRIKQLNPVLANPSNNPHYVNAGKYTASANVLGVGLVYQFDSPAEPPTKPGAAPPPEERPKAGPEPEEEPETGAAATKTPEKNPEAEKKKVEEKQEEDDFQRALDEELEKKKKDKEKKKGK